MSKVVVRSLREIDELIAKHIDRWVLPPFSSVVGAMWVDGKGTIHPEGPRYYTTDPVANQQLVESIDARGYNDEFFNALPEINSSLLVRQAIACLKVISGIEVSLQE